MRSSNETLIRALRILANDIKSDDGVAQAAIFEGAQRIEELMDRIKRLEKAGDWLCAAAAFMGWHDKIEAWTAAKEAKP